MRVSIIHSTLCMAFSLSQTMDSKDYVPSSDAAVTRSSDTAPAVTRSADTATSSGGLPAQTGAEKSRFYREVNAAQEAGKEPYAAPSGAPVTRSQDGAPAEHLR